MDWKKDFLDLYISKQEGDFAKALDLKRQHTPEKLYRFRNLDNTDFIREEICEGKIYLAHPSQMNDPFDACSLLAGKTPAEYMKDKQKYMDQFNGKIDPREFDEIFEHEDWYNRLTSFVAMKSVSSDAVDQAKLALLHAVMAEIEMLNSTVNKLIRDYARFACFTETPNNLPMWNHYAQGHTGVCLEYETSDILNVYTLNRMFPVYYTDMLPDAISKMIDKELPVYPFIDYFLIHKLSDWSYEREWRLIYDVGAWYYGPEDVPADFWINGKQINFIRPSKIYLGAKIVEKDETIIREWGNKLRIPVCKMKCTEYGLEALL